MELLEWLIRQYIFSQASVVSMHRVNFLSGVFLSKYGPEPLLVCDGKSRKYRRKLGIID